MNYKVRNYIETAIYAVVTIVAMIIIATVLCIAGCIICMVI